MVTASITEVAAGRSRVVGRTFVAVVAGAAALALAAHVRFYLPGNPVPLTLQTLAVLLAGAWCGPVAGLGAVALYLAVGLAGAPIFAAGAAGWFYLLGPTGGYLFGFLLAAPCVAWLLSRTDSRWGLLGALTLGALIMLGAGALQLALVNGLGAGRALALGVAPFLPGEALKVGLAYHILRAQRR